MSFTSYGSKSSYNIGAKSMKKNETGTPDRLDEIMQALDKFVSERDWRQFHSPKNLSMSIAIEAAEIMEIFQWETVEESWKIKNDEKRFNHLKEEIADVLAYTLGLAGMYNLDIKEIMLDKIKKNAQKYPAKEFKGKY
jgi:NTP pyrophosphatase (non-canonical NTP hydrolase)